MEKDAAGCRAFNRNYIVGGKYELLPGGYDMKEKMRTIGYLCPRCRKPVMQQRSRFALAASGAIVQCECGKSELQIDFDGEKFRISVPCGVCGGEHLAECGADRLLDGAGIGLAGKELSLTSYGNDGALIKDSGIYMGSQDVEINTANPKIADKNTDLPAEGSVRVVSKAIQVEAVDYETKDDKTEEKSLTKEGSFTLRAEKINLNATDTEGKATGTIAANAKTVEVKAMDVDKEKRTDKELAAGSSLLLLAEKVYAGARDKKTRSKSVQVASDKVGLFGDTTVELQQDGKAILQLSGGAAALSGSKTALYGEMTSQGKSTFKSDVTAGTVEMKNLKVDSSFKTPYTTEGISVPGAPSTAKLSAKLSEEELKSNNG